MYRTQLDEEFVKRITETQSKVQELSDRLHLLNMRKVGRRSIHQKKNIDSIGHKTYQTF